MDTNQSQGLYDDTAVPVLTARPWQVRINQWRAFLTTLIRGSDGAEIGTLTNPIRTQEVGGGSAGTASVDETPFTPGVNSGTPMMGVVTPSDNPPSGDLVIAAVDSSRNVRVSVAPAPVVNISQVTVGNTATLLIAANAKRLKVRVTNTGTTPVYVGAANTVTTSNGDLLAGIAGYPWISRFSGTLYGIVGSGNTAVTVYEETIT